MDVAAAEEGEENLKFLVFNPAWSVLIDGLLAPRIKLSL